MTFTLYSLTISLALESQIVTRQCRSYKSRQRLSPWSKIAYFSMALRRVRYDQGWRGVAGISSKEQRYTVGSQGWLVTGSEPCFRADIIKLSLYSPDNKFLTVAIFTLSVINKQMFYCSMQTVIDNTHTNEQGCVPIKLYDRASGKDLVCRPQMVNVCFREVFFHRNEISASNANHVSNLNFFLIATKETGVSNFGNTL